MFKVSIGHANSFSASWAKKKKKKKESDLDEVKEAMFQVVEWP
jgi:hypothetical protein